GDLGAEAGQIARRVQLGGRSILRIEDTRAGANGPTRGRAPGDSQPRGKVVTVLRHPAPAQPSIACDLDGRIEPEVHSLIEVPAGDGGFCVALPKKSNCPWPNVYELAFQRSRLISPPKRRVCLPRTQ